MRAEATPYQLVHPTLSEGYKPQATYKASASLASAAGSRKGQLSIDTEGKRTQRTVHAHRHRLILRDGSYFAGGHSSGSKLGQHPVQMGVRHLEKEAALLRKES